MKKAGFLEVMLIFLILGLFLTVLQYNTNVSTSFAQLASPTPTPRPSASPTPTPPPTQTPSPTPSPSPFPIVQYSYWNPDGTPMLDTLTNPAIGVSVAPHSASGQLTIRVKNEGNVPIYFYFYGFQNINTPKDVSLMTGGAEHFGSSTPIPVGGSWQGSLSLWFTVPNGGNYIPGASFGYNFDACFVAQNVYNTNSNYIRSIHVTGSANYPSSPTPTPDPTATPQWQFVGSTESSLHRYHYPNCFHVSSILPSNLIHFISQEDALSKGYTPCEDCRPPPLAPTPSPTINPSSVPTTTPSAPTPSPTLNPTISTTPSLTPSKAPNNDPTPKESPSNKPTTSIPPSQSPNPTNNPTLTPSNTQNQASSQTPVSGPTQSSPDQPAESSISPDSSRQINPAETPSPTVPELSLMAILILFALILPVIVLRKRQHRHIQTV